MALLSGLEMSTQRISPSFGENGIDIAAASTFSFFLEERRKMPLTPPTNGMEFLARRSPSSVTATNSLHLREFYL